MARERDSYEHYADWHYKNKFACFDCRKVFKEHERFVGLRCCPQCGGEVVRMPKSWRPPAQDNVKEWERFRPSVKTPEAPPKYQFIPTRMRRGVRA